jgi:hypothetical protein
VTIVVVKMPELDSRAFYEELLRERPRHVLDFILDFAGVGTERPPH